MEKNKKDAAAENFQFGEQELIKYQAGCTKTGLHRKLAGYAQSIGAELVYKALLLWYVLMKPEVPVETKAVIMGAIGYLISPLDFIPDLTPILGYTDDLAAILFTLNKVQAYIDDDVRQKARAAANRFFPRQNKENLTQNK